MKFIKKIVCKNAEHQGPYTTFPFHHLLVGSLDGPFTDKYLKEALFQLNNKNKPLEPGYVSVLISSVQYAQQPGNE
jgi:hypothetical protein